MVLTTDQSMAVSLNLKYMSRPLETHMTDPESSDTRGFISLPTHEQSRQLEGECRI